MSLNSCELTYRWYECRIHDPKQLGRGFCIGMRVYVKDKHDGLHVIVFNGVNTYRVTTKDTCRQCLSIIRRCDDDTNCSIEEVFDAVNLNL